MWHLVGAAVVGAIWARRGAPRTRITPSQVVGARSGQRWRVEYLDDLGQMVVIGQRARVGFKRDEQGWKAMAAGGNPDEIAMIRKDFEP